MVEHRIEFTQGPALPAQELAWLMAFPGGAVQLVVTRAKPPGLAVTPSVTLEQLREACLEAVADLPLLGIAVTHANGRLDTGDPMLAVGAVAEHRAEAFRAVDRLLVAMKGVAKRRDASP